MRDCRNVDVRDALPDLVHDRLGGAEREALLAHVASCADCAAELEVIRAARSVVTATAPSVDHAAIARAVRADLAGRTPAPLGRRDAQTVPRWVADPAAARPRWARRAITPLRLAAALLVMAVGVGGTVIARGDRDVTPQSADVAARPSGDSLAEPSMVVAETTRAGSGVGPRSATDRVDLALGATFSDLTDAELAAVIDAIAGTDAGLPSAEPVPASALIDLDGALE